MARVDEMDRVAPSASEADVLGAKDDAGPWATARVPGTVAAVAGGAWVVLILAAEALVPPAAADAPEVGLLGDILGVAFALALLGTIAGIAARRRWGLLLGIGTALLLVADVIVCPVSGHHSFAGWWYAQLACVVALLAVTVAALHRSSGSPGPSRSGT